MLPPAAGVAAVGAAEEDTGRARDDLEVEPGGPVLDIPEVELDAVPPEELRTAVHLGPAGQAGLHVEPLPLPWRVLLDLVSEGRARADEAHLAVEDVPELRHLVYGEAAQDPPHSGDARIG